MRLEISLFSDRAKQVTKPAHFSRNLCPMHFDCSHDRVPLHSEVNGQACSDILRTKLISQRIKRQCALQSADSLKHFHFQFYDALSNRVPRRPTVKRPPFRTSYFKSLFSRVDSIASLLILFQRLFHLPMSELRSGKILNLNPAYVLRYKGEIAREPHFLFKNCELRLKNIESLYCCLAIGNLALDNDLPLNGKPSDDSRDKRHYSCEEISSETDPIGRLSFTNGVNERAHPKWKQKQRGCKPHGKCDQQHGWQRNSFHFKKMPRLLNFVEGVAAS